MGEEPSSSATARMVRLSMPSAATASAASMMPAIVSELRARRGRGDFVIGILSGLAYSVRIGITYIVRKPFVYRSPMSLLRWLPTFLAFPLGGFLSLLVFGSSASPLVALGGGLIVGASIGGAQWLALGRLAGRRWFAATTIAVAAGSVAASLIIGPPTSLTSAALTGLAVGAFVGTAQALVLPAPPRA